MKLTDRDFWLKYWETKGNLIKEVKSNYILGEILKNLKKEYNLQSGIELGGFPGYYAIYMKKWLGIDATLFDYVIHPTISKDLILENELNTQDIQLVEGDLFTDKPNETYDLVMSVGLIEHFENTEEIIEQHLKYLNNSGVLFINIPNFTGFNGWIQKTFDLEMYNKHNIKCMDPAFLHEACKSLGLKNIKVGYYGGFMIWLENMKSKNILFRVAFKCVWFILKVYSKIIRRESKLLSPYINIIATK